MAHLEKSQAMSVTNNIKEEDEFVIKEPTIVAPYNKEFLLDYIFFFTYCNIAGVYGLYLFFTSAKWGTIVFTIIIYILTLLGITAGAHRLFAHNSYKATKPLQIFLMLCHCFAVQKSLFTWIQEHRLHHKFSDTDADPHNASRGFFYSHVGWLLVKSHPEMDKRRSLIDMSDVYENEVLMFQKRNTFWMLALIGFVLPTVIPWLLGDTFSNCWHVNLFRYALTLNLTFLTNSLSHSWGYQPYDKTMKACQNLPIIFLTMGEGYHNYHHAFPWDYSASELGNNGWNFITKFIDCCEMFGLAYDLKKASGKMVDDRKRRTGDGSDLWGQKIQYPN